MRPVAERLHQGSLAVRYLFGQLARVPVALLMAVSLAACAYYLSGVSFWLWGLRDGAHGAEIQGGVVLALAGLVVSWITSRFAQKLVSSNGVLLRHRGPGSREGEPLLSLAVGACSAGVMLQLLAFAGLLMT